MAASPSPSPDADIGVGSVLDGRYRIDAILGSGGMGRVYRAEHTGIGRPVAIKVLHADLSRNREAAQRFQREAIASGRLDHPNIVNVSDFGIVDDGPCYLVMEVLEGEPLGARLEREKRIPWRESIEILRGVLAGLKHAHERGVVHRDIKPDNVFLTKKDGELVVKILDFGIAKLFAGNADDPASTRAGLTVGTPAYLSPEQAVGGEIKPASDLYSATIVLFEMITGRAPFEDKDPLAMLGAHVSREPPRIADVAPDAAVPEPLEAVIQKGLIKTSADRIQSADEYVRLLDEVVASARLGAGSAPHAAQAAPPGQRSDAPGPWTGVIGSAPTAMLSTGNLTPVPGGNDNTMILLTEPKLPAPARPVSLAEAPPIPRNWIKVGATVLVVLAAVFVITMIATRGGGSPKDIASPVDGSASADKPDKPAAKSDKADKPAAKSDKPAAKADKSDDADKPAVAPPTGPMPIPVPSEATVGEDAELKAALKDLKDGKTCADRKAAVAKLVDIGDPKAIPALKQARYRMRGGVLGFGEKNANYCLKADADTAIKTLGNLRK